MSKVKWAIIGPGGIAQEFSEALKKCGGTLYAVGSRSLDKAQHFAEQYGADKAYGDYNEMLQDPEIDAVYVSTPHSNHYEYIIESLKHGKHVLAEKAITVNITQLREIAALAEEKGLVVAEAMTIYHMPLYDKLRQIVDSGKIGPLKMIQVSFGSYKEYDVNNRFFNKDLAGGALLDIGTYALSFARFFLSAQPKEILTTFKPFETGVDEQSGILLKNDADEMTVISLTMRAKMPKRGVVAGENGFITVDNFPRASKAVIQYLDGTSETIEAGDTDEAIQYEIKHMEQAIAAGSSGTLQLSLDVMEIMSNVRGQWGITYPFE
ncbi:Predicted dehydrogenase [Paenibacillus sophorae]|uniref:Gfo/Idh/MocA family oxidoreductase n=1 Tax=Paenibacillus sophorae TaxID=1333845 RepID=A0A1H8IUL2_9BACL|nr:Gfo/Idh/MocA family oxidoreductase [Paenibacillus sophorae]QWU16086.1 Gfo/Idh/MocA family oxidoreductase [Paenibacillus sophorae]SEN72162.1 Predicted dehydrogenase [Paenibacillus sophorae]